MEREERLYTTGPLSGAWALLLALPVGLAAAVDVRWALFGFAAVASAVLAVRNATLLLGAVLTFAASDLVLTVDVGNFTFRAAQMAGVALTAAAIARDGVRGYLRFLTTRPGLLAWVAFIALQVLSLTRGLPNPGKAVGYVAWAIFDALVLAPSVAWHARRHFPRTIALWSVGATCVALFGLSQLVLALVGVEPPLVTQWVGPRPRINAFSYEPSYFAFQAIIPIAILCGLSVSTMLRRFAGPATACAAVLSAALFLSSSRSAWGGLAILLGAFLVVTLMKRQSLWSLPAQRVLAAFAAVVVIAAIFAPPSMLIGDRVLASRALDLEEAASAQPRKEGLVMAWRLFRVSPVLGVGPGQYGGALLAHPEIWTRDIPVEKRNPDDLVTFNVYFELLCEAGLLGSLIAGAAVLWTLWSLWKLRRHGTRGRLALAMLWPVLLTFGVMYQFNQTLWRTEVWCLLGMCWSLWPRVVTPRDS